MASYLGKIHFLGCFSVWHIQIYTLKETVSWEGFFYHSLQPILGEKFLTSRLLWVLVDISVFTRELSTVPPFNFTWSIFQTTVMNVIISKPLKNTIQYNANPIAFFPNTLNFFNPAYLLKCSYKNIKSHEFPVVILERTDWPQSTRLTPLSIYQLKEECEYWAGIFKESLGARNRGGRGLSYRPAARLHRLAEFIHWNRFRGPIHV